MKQAKTLHARAANNTNPKVKYKLEDLFANPEFHLLKDLNDQLNLDDNMYYVHRLTCNGVVEGDAIMNFYPFITTDAKNNA